MSNTVKAIPDGYAAVTPYLIIKGANKAIDFYKKAFNATEVMCLNDDKGNVCHAEMRINQSVVMFGEECLERGARSPLSTDGTAISIHLYVNNVDEVVKNAVAAGAKIIRAVENQFYGDRSGMIVDPFGHTWNVATHVEDVSAEEIERRMAEVMKKTTTA